MAGSGSRRGLPVWSPVLLGSMAVLLALVLRVVLAGDAAHVLRWNKFATVPLTAGAVCVYGCYCRASRRR